MNAKQLFKSLDESQRQDIAENLVRNGVIACQSALVDELLNKKFFNFEDIENLYEDNEEGDSEPQDIYEWWIVNAWFADKLRKAGQPILSTDYGTWWGRTCTGQSIACDYNIQLIACEIECEIQNASARVRKAGL